MKKVTFRFSLLMIIVGISLAFLAGGCDKSSGLKFGTLQKVSHKQFPCNYYVAEFSFDGGRVISSDNGSSYVNTQEVEITSQQYIELQRLIGEKVIFDYEDKGIALCGESKKLKLIRKKEQNPAQTTKQEFL